MITAVIVVIVPLVIGLVTGYVGRYVISCEKRLCSPLRHIGEVLQEASIGREVGVVLWKRLHFLGPAIVARTALVPITDSLFNLVEKVKNKRTAIQSGR